MFHLLASALSDFAVFAEAMLDELNEELLQGLCTISSTAGVVPYFHSFVGAEAAVTGFANNIWHRSDLVASVYFLAIDYGPPAIGDNEV